MSRPHDTAAPDVRPPARRARPLVVAGFPDSWETRSPADLQPGDTLHKVGDERVFVVRRVVGQTSDRVQIVSDENVRVDILHTTAIEVLVRR